MGSAAFRTGAFFLRRAALCSKAIYRTTKGSPRHGERGQVLPLIAFALLPLIGLAALAVDVGVSRYQQQLAQTAADSGALAAAVELKNSGSLAQIYAAANVDITANGFAGNSVNGSLNTANKVTVTVNNPPTSGPATSNSSAVEVLVKKALPVYFSWLAATVSARAVGVANIGNCLTALDTSNSAVFILDNGTINMPNCGMMSNGQLLFNGGTIDANSIESVYAVTGSATYTKALPKITAAVVDPCSTVTGCAYLTANPPTPGSCYGIQAINAPTTLNPNTYCNTTFNGSGTVTFNPGFYYFSGGFNVNGSVSLAGTGVTLYNAGGTFNFGNGTENLVAPTTGNDANVVIFQPSSDTNSLTFNGTAAAVLTGLVYAPASQVILDGTSTTLTDVVAKDITINASGTMTFPSSSSSSTSGLSE
jgi:Flp pilus assembly protein TadG